MMQSNHTVTSNGTATFDIHALAGKLPELSETMLVDVRLTDEPAASCRLFRVYKPVPLHYHVSCDEYLMVISGRGKFVVGDGAEQELGPGQLLFFRRGTVHSITEIVEDPLVVLAVDTPRRSPDDVVFVDSTSGTAGTFIRTLTP